METVEEKRVQTESVASRSCLLTKMAFRSAGRKSEILE